MYIAIVYDWKEDNCVDFYVTCFLSFSAIGFNNVINISSKAAQSVSSLKE